MALLLEKVDLNKNKEAELDELMKVQSLTIEKASQLYPGVVIKPWIPSET